MLIKGVSAIKGTRQLYNRPGPNSESSKLLQRYQLMVERENLQKRRVWIRGQQEQTEKRLAQISRAMRVIEGKTRGELATSGRTGFRSTVIQY